MAGVHRHARVEDHAVDRQAREGLTQLGLERVEVRVRRGLGHQPGFAVAADQRGAGDAGNPQRRALARHRVERAARRVDGMGHAAHHMQPARRVLERQVAHAVPDAAVGVAQLVRGESLGGLEVVHRHMGPAHDHLADGARLGPAGLIPGHGADLRHHEPHGEVRVGQADAHAGRGRQPVELVRRENRHRLDLRRAVDGVGRAVCQQPLHAGQQGRGDHGAADEGVADGQGLAGRFGVVAQPLVERGRAGQERHAVAAHLRKQHGGVGLGDAAGRVGRDDAGAAMAERVEEQHRPHGHVDAVRRLSRMGVQRGELGDDVAVRSPHRLRHARRPGGVHDHRRVVGRDRGDLRVRRRGRQAPGEVAPHPERMRNAAQRPAPEPRQAGRRHGEDGLGPGVRAGGVHMRQPRARVDEHAGGAHLADAQDHRVEGGRHRHEHQHPIARAHAPRAQPAGHAVGAVSERVEAQRLLGGGARRAVPQGDLLAPRMRAEQGVVVEVRLNRARRRRGRSVGRVGHTWRSWKPSGCRSSSGHAGRF
ncbi:hypothetical protein D3C72_1043140 [compost metagenome]